MTSLILSLLVIGVGLGVLLYAGSLFLQGYIYTVPSSGLAWQAPAAAAVLTGFLMIWCLMIANSATARPSEIPYDSFFRFSPQVSMTREPLKHMTAIHKDKSEVVYQLYKEPGLGRTTNRYVEKKALDRGDSRLPGWKPDNVKAIRIKHDGKDMIFELTPTGEGANREFVNAETGFTIIERSGSGGAEPSDIPVAFRWSRFLANLFLNFVHFALWFLCLWLLLRFQWGHALGLAIVAWLLATLVFLPMLLDTAGQVAVDQRTPGTVRTAALPKKLAPRWTATGACC